MQSNWKTFGPSSSHSDGDAQYYQLTNRLTEQYNLFTPRPEDLGAADGVDEAPSTRPQPEQGQEAGFRSRSSTRPEFGLSPKQIAALGLAGPRVNTPDPVSVQTAAWVLCDQYAM